MVTLTIAPVTFVLVVIKLAVHPLLAWAVAHWLLRLEAAQAATLMLAAALPAAGTAFLFAERQQADADRIAGVIMISTAAAFLTFSLLAALVR